MEIILFQLFIVTSMAVARVVSPQGLVISAIVWTVLTLALVFAAPLVLFQLFVIWLAYSVLAPKVRPSATGEDNDCQPDKKILDNAETSDLSSAPDGNKYREAISRITSGEIATDGIFYGALSPAETLIVEKLKLDSAEDSDLTILAARANDLLKKIDEAKASRSGEDPSDPPTT